MARRRSSTRKFVLAVAALAVIGLAAGGYKKFGHRANEVVKTPTTHPAAITDPAAPQPVVIAAPDFTKPRALGPKASPPVALLDVPTTRPALLIVSLPTPTTPANAAALFKTADEKIAADDLVGARDALAADLATKKFTDADREAALARLQKINDTLVFSPRKFVSDPHQTAYTVVAGDNLQKIANKFDVTVGFLQRVNNVSNPSRIRLGQSLKIVNGPFHAVVNKTQFYLDLYQGQPGTAGAVFLKRLRVGLGENDSTPTGLWKIGTKLLNPTYYNSRNEGPRVIDADDPKNPLGERWLALEGVQGQAVGKESYGIHGTIDPASIGQKKSMGCIRLLNEDINLVYDMLIKDKSTVLVVE